MRMVDRLDSLVARARAQQRQVVLVVAALPPAPANRRAQPVDSARDTVRGAVLRSAQQRWADIASSGTVAAVVSMAGSGRRGERFFAAPSLGARAGIAAPSRGFMLLTLGRSAHPHVVPYDPASASFQTPTRASLTPGGGERGSIRRFVDWVWTLADSDRDLAVATVFGIALLFAFLTVAALWRVPEPGRISSTTTTTTASSTTVGGTTTNATTQPGGALMSGGIFEGNLARTVVSGLTGIATVTILTQFWNLSGVNAEALYVVVFVAAFLLLLVVIALLRAAVETLRSRIASSPVIPRWERPRRSDAASSFGFRRLVMQRLGAYWASRAWRWLLTVREGFLVFFDTFMNVVMGRSYSANVVWEERIVDLQRMLLRATDRVREEITTALQEAIVRHYGHLQSPPNDPELSLLSLQQSVRVSISVLSDDQQSVFYISAAPGSLSKMFTQQSVAWVAAYSGEARWWFSDYNEIPDLVLFDNSSNALPGVGAVKLRMSEYLQARRQSDYNAFVVIPIPWRRRHLRDDTRRGLIHIAFGKAEWMQNLWGGLLNPDPYSNAALGGSTQTASPPARGGDISPFTDANSVLDSRFLQDDALRAVLFQSVNVLAELVSEFDQTVYESRLRKQRGS